MCACLQRLDSKDREISSKYKMKFLTTHTHFRLLQREFDRFVFVTRIYFQIGFFLLFLNISIVIIAGTHSRSSGQVGSNR